MIMFSAMPKTEISYEAEDGSVLITQHQDQGAVSVWFPAEMADSIAASIRAAGAAHLQRNDE